MDEHFPFKRLNNTYNEGDPARRRHWELAKRKMDAYGCVQSHCFDQTYPKRMVSEEYAMMLAASMAGVSNTTKAEQADAELVPMAATALIKLHKNGTVCSGIS